MRAGLHGVPGVILVAHGRFHSTQFWYCILVVEAGITAHRKNTRAAFRGMQGAWLSMLQPCRDQAKDASLRACSRAFLCIDAVSHTIETGSSQIPHGDLAALLATRLVRERSFSSPNYLIHSSMPVSGMTRVFHAWGSGWDVTLPCGSGYL